MAVQPDTPLIVQMLASTPLLVTILDGILVAVILALLVLQLGGAATLALVIGAAGFIVTVGAFTWYATRDITRAVEAYQPLFPGPTQPSP
jgi:hypothetical protein